MWQPQIARAARRPLASQILETVQAALLPGAAGRIVPPPNCLVSCRDAFCARRSSCTRLTASAVAAYKIRLTRASRDWRLRGPRPRWSRGPRASYSSASGRLKDLNRLFCLIECRGRGVRGSLEGPTPPGSNEAPSCPSGSTQNEGRMHTLTHLLDGVQPCRVVCAARRLRWPALHEACAVHVVEERPNAVEEQRARILARRRFRDGRGGGSGRIVSDRGGT